jgi:hypothetical protein
MKALRFFIASLLFSLFTGCGDDLARVSGTVMLDGQPIAGGPGMYGTVSFYPESGSGVPAVGIIDESGRYELKSGSRDGLVPGSYLVGIAVKKITMPTRPGGMPQPTLITPKKYADVTKSGFQQEVAPGANTFDFALTSK